MSLRITNKKEKQKRSHSQLVVRIFFGFGKEKHFK